MSKRLPKKAESPFKHLQSAPVYVANREMTEDTKLALTEQLFEMQKNPDDIAKLIASKLDKDCKEREFYIRLVALMLDPKEDSYFNLVVERRRSGKTWTRRANDAALVKAVIEREQVVGSRKAAVKDISDGFGAGEGTIRKALRNSK